VLLDQRLLESCGDAIAARSVFVLLLTVFAALPNASHAQPAADAGRLIASFRAEWPDVYARLIGMERAHGVLYAALARGKGKLNEPEVLRLMTGRVAQTGLSARPDPEAEQGYAALGARAAEIIRRTHEFHREVLAIFAGLDASNRAGALDAAVDRYLSRREVALPDVPKDMTILYDHPYTSFVDEDFTPRRKQPYPSLTGFVWASHWFQLAVEEPLELLTDSRARLDAVKVVTERFQRKLSAGKPPDAFPTELPLSPCISPGLVSAHVRAAAIIDNLNMMHDVLADVLIHPKVGDVRAAIDEVIAQFTDPRYRIVEVDDWITMALRHSIFQQGGPALGTMTANERNTSGHAQHSRGARAMPPRGMQ
jgi:hypothetical protein